MSKIRNREFRLYIWTFLHHMVILRSQNKITDFLMILACASPFNRHYGVIWPTLPQNWARFPLCVILFIYLL